MLVVVAIGVILASCLLVNEFFARLDSIDWSGYDREGDNE